MNNVRKDIIVGQQYSPWPLGSMGSIWLVSVSMVGCGELRQGNGTACMDACPSIKGGQCIAEIEIGGITYLHL